jgi:hypothetical protein
MHNCSINLQSLTCSINNSTFLKIGVLLSVQYEITRGLESLPICWIDVTVVYSLFIAGVVPAQPVE